MRYFFSQSLDLFKLYRKLSTFKSDDGYKVTYDSDMIELVDNLDADIDDSAYFRCIIDKENMYENYMDVRFLADYTAEEFIEGIAYQSGAKHTETFEDTITFINGEHYAYGCYENVTDTFAITTYAFQGKDGIYVIEIGDHLYSDDNEYAYRVAGAMEELFLSVELDI